MSAPPKAVTRCPVDWCGEAGDHPWLPEEESDAGFGVRFHRRVTGQIATSEPTHPVVVAAEVYQTTAAITPPVVEISNDSGLGIELTSAEDVAAFVTAVMRAASVAFPDGPIPLVDDYCDGGDDCGTCGAWAIWTGLRSSFDHRGEVARVIPAENKALGASADGD